jgi:hypothetical protein
MFHNSPNRYVRPERFTPQTLVDAGRYFGLAELIRVFEAELAAETAERLPGQRLGRREQALTLTLQHLRRATRSLAPLAGLESWTQAAE